MLKDLVKKSRSYRIFDESHKLSREDLLDLIDIANQSIMSGAVEKNLGGCMIIALNRKKSSCSKN